MWEGSRVIFAMVQGDIDKYAGVSAVRQRNGDSLARPHLPFCEHPVARMQSATSGLDVVLHILFVILIADKWDPIDLRPLLYLRSAWRTERRIDAEDVQPRAAGDFAGLAAKVAITDAVNVQTEVAVRKALEALDG